MKQKFIALLTLSVFGLTNLFSGISYAQSYDYNYPLEWEVAVGFMKNYGLSSTANSVAEYIPTATVNREAASKFFVNFAKNIFNKENYVRTESECNFTDLLEAQDWARPYIIESCKLGLFKGEKGKFFPKQELTKMQFLTVLGRMVKDNPNLGPIEAYFYLKKDGITNEPSYKSAIRPITRIELALLFKRAFEKYGQNTEDVMNDLQNLINEEDEEENNSGDQLINQGEQGDGGNQGEQGENEDDDSLLNNLFSDEEDEEENNEQTEDNQEQDEQDEQDEQESGQIEAKLYVIPETDGMEKRVPGKTSHLRVLKLKLKAGSEDVKLNKIDLAIQGIAHRNVVDDVYVEDEDYILLTNAKKFNSYNKASLLFKNFTIPAGEEKIVYVSINLDTTAVHSFNIVVEDIKADVPVEATFPIISDRYTTTSYTVSNLFFESSKSEEETSYIKLYVGETDQILMQFTLQNQSSNNSDVILKQIKFRNTDEQLKGIIDNVRLYTNNEEVSLKKVVIEGKEVILVVDDYIYPDGASQVFTVKADIVGGEKDDKIQLYLDELTDIVAVEEKSSYMTQVEVGNDKKYYRGFVIEEGDNLITRSSETPVGGYVPIDENNVAILVANFNTTNDIYVEKIRVFRDDAMSASVGSNLDIRRIKLYIDDKYVDDTDVEHNDGINSGTNFWYEFDYYGYLNKGPHTFTVKVDISKNANGIIKFKILPESIAFGNNAEYVDTSNTVFDNEIKGEAVSNTQIIKKPKIETVARNDGMTDGEYIIAGAQNSFVARYTFQVNNVRDIRITDMKFRVDITDDSNGSSIEDVTNLALVVNEQIVAIENVEWNITQSDVLFNGLNITIPKGETKDVDVYITLNSSFKQNDKIQVTLLEDDFQAEDLKGNQIQENGFTTNGIPSAEFIVKESGNLYISMSSDSPSERVIAGTTLEEIEVARFRLKAVDDNIQLHELTLINVGNNNSVTNVQTGDSNAYNGADNVVNKVILYSDNGTKLAEGNLIDGIVYLILPNPYTFEKDVEQDLIVKIKPNNISNESNTNKFIKFTMLKQGESYVIDGSKRTKFVSESNGNDVNTSNITYTNVVGNLQILRKTLFDIIADSSTDTLTNGENILYSFTIDPYSAGSIKVKQFVFDVDVNGNSLGINDFKFLVNGTDYVANSKVEIKDANGSDITTNGGNSIGNGTNKIMVTFVGIENNGFNINSETTFTLKANVSAVSDDDSISVSLEEKVEDAIGKYTADDLLNPSVTPNNSNPTVTTNYNQLGLEIYENTFEVNGVVKITQIAGLDLTITNGDSDHNATVNKITLKVLDGDGNVLFVTNQIGIGADDNGNSHNIQFTLNKVLDNGTYTYKIYVTNDSSNQHNDDGDTVYDTITVDGNATITATDIIPSIIWSDKAANNVQTSTQDWFTEAKIPGINDLGTQTLNE